MKNIFQETCEESNEDFYNEIYLEESMESDEISSIEEGFMRGYLN